MICDKWQSAEFKFIFGRRRHHYKNFNDKRPIFRACNPTLPLTGELVKRGHQVSYINAEEFRTKIEMTGAAFLPYVNFPIGISEENKKRTCFQAAYDTAMALEESYDVLVYEMFFYPGLEIARKKKIPCVRQFSQPAWSEDTWKNTSILFKISAKLIDIQVMGKKGSRPWDCGASPWQTQLCTKTGFEYRLCS